MGPNKGPGGHGAEAPPYLHWGQVDLEQMAAPYLPWVKVVMEQGIPLVYTGSTWTWSRGSFLSTLGPGGHGAEAPPCLHWVQVDVEETIPLLQVGSEWTSSRRSSLFCICLEISSTPLSPALPKAFRIQLGGNLSWIGHGGDPHAQDIPVVLPVRHPALLTSLDLDPHVGHGNCCPAP